MLKNLFPLLSPDIIGGIAQPKDLTPNETIKLLGEDDEKEEVLDLKSKKETKTEDKDKDKEDDDEDSDEKEIELADDDDEAELEDDEEVKEDETEEEFDLISPPRRKEILAKYPNLFKDFPYLNKSYYRERQFTEMFPTMDDAKTAVAKSETLDRFERDLLSGDTEHILKVVKDTDDKAFKKIVDNYLPTLAKVDQGAVWHIVGNTIKDTIVSMVGEAKKTDNDALRTAAQILNQFVFGTSEFEPKRQLTESKPEDNKEKDDLRRERETFHRQRFETTKNELSTKVSNVLKATIDANIDPKDSMTSYVKKTATRETLEALTEKLENDRALTAVIDKLWAQAFKSNFSAESINRIRSTYLSRAKMLLPSVIQKARNEALKGLGKRAAVESDDSDERDEKPSRKGTLPVGRATSSPSGKSAKEQAKQIPANMRSVDYLLQD